jgi:hypothetical protein
MITACCDEHRRWRYIGARGIQVGSSELHINMCMSCMLHQSLQRSNLQVSPCGAMPPAHACIVGPLCCFAFVFSTPCESSHP